MREILIAQAAELEKTAKSATTRRSPGNAKNKSTDQVGGVIASLIWLENERPAQQRQARLARFARQ